jgi:transcriptional regulator with XRE-family HTH domain
MNAMLRHLLPPKDKLPTRFSRALGQRIKDAREEREMSQTELGEQVYRRQAAISQMENGLMEPPASTLMLLAAALEKPVTYFFPPPWTSRVPQSDLSPLEQELIMELRELPELEQRMILEEVKLKRRLAAQIQREQLDAQFTAWRLEDADSEEDNS